jgi:prolyl-tRNA editing enzyme YbaK/EbsC (Cys-tRNA(Pro) deacylase)
LSAAWPEPVERVVRVLRDANVEARVEEFSEGTPTAEAAARVAGAELGQIVKSLVVSCDGRAIVVLVPGDRRADTARIAVAAGCERVKSAAPEAVARATGFPAGGVAPFPLPGIETVLVDRGLLAHEVVWIGAGSERHMAALAPADLVRLARARPADLAADPSDRNRIQ